MGSMMIAGKTFGNLDLQSRFPLFSKQTETKMCQFWVLSSSIFVILKGIGLCTNRRCTIKCLNETVLVSYNWLDKFQFQCIHLVSVIKQQLLDL